MESTDCGTPKFLLSGSVAVAARAIGHRLLGRGFESRSVKGFSCFILSRIRDSFISLVPRNFTKLALKRRHSRIYLDVPDVVFVV